MTLYGLDIIIDREGRNNLCEINGVRSGMGGFQTIYGDNRVEEKVWRMLQEKHGKLTINYGRYLSDKSKKERQLSFYLSNIYDFLLNPFSFHQRMTRLPVYPIFRDSSAEIMWVSELEWPGVSENFSTEFDYAFEEYSGQESTVLNIINHKLPHPLVNPFIDEHTTRNKLLQYVLLRDTCIGPALSKSVLVGLNVATHEEIDKLLIQGDHFVVKPILGVQGKGIRIINKEEALKYGYEDDKPNKNIYLDVLKRIAVARHRSLGMRDISDDLFDIKSMAEEGEYDFESVVSLLQQFVDSKEVINGQETYSVIRAIVCNGIFVDAYRGISPEPCVNNSRKATNPCAFEADDGFREFCEKTVLIYSEQCAQLHPEDYKKQLYSRYFSPERKGRDSELNFKVFVLDMLRSEERR